jgi:hypothetical protein
VNRFRQRQPASAAACARLLAGSRFNIMDYTLSSLFAAGEASHSKCVPRTRCASALGHHFQCTAGSSIFPKRNRALPLYLQQVAYVCCVPSVQCLQMEPINVIASASQIIRGQINVCIGWILLLIRGVAGSLCVWDTRGRQVPIGVHG